MTASQLDLLAQLETITDDQGDEKTPQGLQEAPEAAVVTLGDHFDAEVVWRGYTLDTTDDEARSLFAARYGRPPARTKRSPGILLAGPLPV